MGRTNHNIHSLEYLRGDKEYEIRKTRMQEIEERQRQENKTLFEWVKET